MICKKCRNNVKTDFKYCPYCGERVISDFHESYGELTPPFIIEDQGQEDEAAKLYAPDPAIERPDFDRYSSAPPSSRNAEKPDNGAEGSPRGYERSPRDYGGTESGYKPEIKPSSSYFVYPEELMYGSLDSKHEDAYDTSRDSDFRYDVPKVVPEPQYEAPKVSEPRYEAPKVSEPRYEAPKVSEPRYEAPKVSEPRYEAPKTSEPYYVYTGASRQDANRQAGYGAPQSRGGDENRNVPDDDLGFDAPDQCIQIDMSFADPGDNPVRQTNRGFVDTDADDAPYHVYGSDAVGERESVLPFDAELSQDLTSARVKQSGSAIAAKLALILLITAVAVAVSIFGYRYITGISNKDAWIIGNTSGAFEPSSSASEPSSSASKPSSSAFEPSSSASAPSSSASEPSSSTAESSSSAAGSSSTSSNT